MATNGDWVYNMAVVADDHEMGITHVRLAVPLVGLIQASSICNMATLPCAEIFRQALAIVRPVL